MKYQISISISNFVILLSLNLILSFFSSTKAQGQIKEYPIRLAEVGQTPDSGPLQKLRTLKREEQWTECHKLASKLIDKNKVIEGWIAIIWMECLENETKDGLKLAGLQKIIGHLMSKPEIFRGGGWAKKLEEGYQLARLTYIEGLLATRQLDAATEKSVVNVLDTFLFENMNGDTKTRVMALRERIYKIVRPEKKSNQRIVIASPSSEDLAFGNLSTSTSTKEPKKLFATAVAFLRDFPNSPRVPAVLDTLVEIISGPDGSDFRLTELEPPKLLQLAQVLHRKAFYKRALEMATRGLESQSEGPAQTSLAWIAGRSSMFLNNAGAALDYFKSIKDKASVEYTEGLFRSLLIEFRKKNYNKVSDLASEILSRPNIDKIQLGTRYYLWRALTALNDPKKEAEKEFILTTAPLSYYGLKMMAEDNKGELYFSHQETPSSTGASKAKPRTSNDIATKLRLSPQQFEVLKRYKLLVKAGWYSEAKQELQFLPEAVGFAEKVIYAKLYFQTESYPVVIKLINEATDLDATAREPNILSMAFPKIYTDIVVQEAEKNRINPLVIWGLMRQESAFDFMAVSSSNALGLMQLIPPTAQEVAGYLKIKNLQTPKDVFVPATNIKMGSRYIRQMLDAFGGNLPLAFASYNAGPTRMKLWVDARGNKDFLDDDIWYDEIPWSETSFYVKAILRNMLIYKMLEGSPFKVVQPVWKTF